MRCSAASESRIGKHDVARRRTPANRAQLESAVYQCHRHSYSWAKVVGLIATLSDTVAATMTWGISRGGILYVISTVVIPAGAGFSSVPINLMSSTLSPGLPIDADGAPYLFLEQANGDTLVGQLTSAVSSGKVLNVNAIGGEY